jgi:hypothetical protein
VLYMLEKSKRSAEETLGISSLDKGNIGNSFTDSVSFRSVVSVPSSLSYSFQNLVK